MTVLEFFITVLLSMNAGFVIGAWWATLGSPRRGATRNNPIETITLAEEDQSHE